MKRLDNLRLLALLVVLLGIVFFYLTVFSPQAIPKLFRVGTVHAPLNLLILGTDTTYDAVTGHPLPGVAERTDTIVLVHFDPVRYRLNFLSLPRDTLVTIPGYGAQKINAAHVYGGLALTTKTVKELTGVRIDYYVMTNPKAVIKLVNLLGGITLYVEKDMRYIDRAGGLDINLKQGWRKLNGKGAHDYIRFRHDSEGDIGRVTRQQNFFRAVNQALNRPTNIIKAPFAILSALGEVKTDLPLAQAVRILMFFRTLKSSDVRTATLSGEALNVEGVGACWVPNKQDTATIVREFF